MKKIALLTGHYGTGTGASFTATSGFNFDEWRHSFLDAHSVSKRLFADGHSVEVCFIDRDSPRDAAIDAILKDVGGLAAKNIDIRFHWAMNTEPDLALEFHYNSDTEHKGRGFEVLIDDGEPAGSKSEALGNCILSAMEGAFPLSPNRGLKRSPLRIAEMFRRRGIPFCLVEPAFVSEERIGEREFYALYHAAIHEGISNFIKRVIPA